MVGSSGVIGLGQTALTAASNGISKGSIFFLHGTCDSGPGLQSWVAKILKKNFQFKEYRVLYPSSPMRPYHLMNGQSTAIWFDRLSPGPDMPEDPVSINHSGELLKQLIQNEQQNHGVKKRKVIVGGFSMGGTMALHLAYRFTQSIAGVFALSSFLPPDSSVYSDLDEFVKQNPQVEPEDYHNITKNGKLLDDSKKQSLVSNKKLPKLLMSLGTRDPLVQPSWTQSTFDQLRTYGVEGHLYTFPQGQGRHEISLPQLNVLHNWIEETLSDSPKPQITETKPFHINDEGTMPVPVKFWPKGSQ